MPKHVILHYLKEAWRVKMVTVVESIYLDNTIAELQGKGHHIVYSASDQSNLEMLKLGCLIGNDSDADLMLKHIQKAFGNDSINFEEQARAKFKEMRSPVFLFSDMKVALIPMDNYSELKHWMLRFSDVLEMKSVEFKVQKTTNTIIAFDKKFIFFTNWEKTLGYSRESTVIVPNIGLILK